MKLLRLKSNKIYFKDNDQRVESQSIEIIKGPKPPFSIIFQSLKYSYQYPPYKNTLEKISGNLKHDPSKVSI
tara:strand:- start:9 stop:224 length:216 start_codon:yes stop_codon:yes gene_type:complete